MGTADGSIGQYMALALQPVQVGAKERGDIRRNLDHIMELAFAAKNVTEIELPGEETNYLSDLARGLNAFVIAQAKVKHPEFDARFFNCAFVIDPQGEIIHKHYKMRVFAREHSTLPNAGES